VTASGHLHTILMSLPRWSGETLLPKTVPDDNILFSCRSPNRMSYYVTKGGLVGFLFFSFS
jgi:hypothetical protein